MTLVRDNTREFMDAMQGRLLCAADDYTDDDLLDLAETYILNYTEYGDIFVANYNPETITPSLRF